MVKNSANAGQDVEMSKEKNMAKVECSIMRADIEINKGLVVEIPASGEYSKDYFLNPMEISASDYTKIFDENSQAIVDNKTGNLLQPKMSESGIEESQESVKKFCKEKGYNSIEKMVSGEKININKEEKEVASR